MESYRRRFAGVKLAHMLDDLRDRSV